MTNIVTFNSIADELCKALGVDNVRRLSIDMEANTPVIVTVEKFVTEDESNQLISVIKKYKLFDPAG